MKLTTKYNFEFGPCLHITQEAMQRVLETHGLKIQSNSQEGDIPVANMDTLEIVLTLQTLERFFTIALEKSTPASEHDVVDELVGVACTASTQQSKIPLAEMPAYKLNAALRELKSQPAWWVPSQVAGFLKDKFGEEFDETKFMATFGQIQKQPFLAKYPVFLLRACSSLFKGAWEKFSHHAIAVHRAALAAMQKEDGDSKIPLAVTQAYNRGVALRQLRNQPDTVQDDPTQVAGFLHKKLGEEFDSQKFRAQLRHFKEQGLAYCVAVPLAARAAMQREDGDSEE